MEYKINYNKQYNVAIVKFEGSLDINNKDKIINIIKDEILPNNMKYVIFVVSNLNYIDSSGLGVLLSARSILNKNNGDLAIVNSSKKLGKILNMAGFNKMFKICENLDEGVKKVKL